MAIKADTSIIKMAGIASEHAFPIIKYGEGAQDLADIQVENIKAVQSNFDKMFTEIDKRSEDARGDKWII